MKLVLASLLACSAAAFVPAGQFSATSPPSSSTTTRLHARKPLISGNWKLNPQTKEEALTLARGIASSITENSPDVEVALFVPYVFIESAMAAVGGKLSVGAEVGSSSLGLLTTAGMLHIYRSLVIVCCCLTLHPRMCLSSFAIICRHNVYHLL